MTVLHGVAIPSFFSLTRLSLVSTDAFVLPHQICLKCGCAVSEFSIVFIQLEEKPQKIKMIAIWMILSVLIKSFACGYEILMISQAVWSSRSLERSYPRRWSSKNSVSSAITVITKTASRSEYLYNARSRTRIETS